MIITLLAFAGVFRKVFVIDLIRRSRSVSAAKDFINGAYQASRGAGAVGRGPGSPVLP